MFFNIPRGSSWSIQSMCRKQINARAAEVELSEARGDSRAPAAECKKQTARIHRAVYIAYV